MKLFLTLLTSIALIGSAHALGLGLGLSKQQAVEGGPSYTALDQLVASNVADLDATLYTSGQTWESLGATANYDFYLGSDGSAGADDPTFTGTGAASYFDLDGGDFFRIPSNTALLTSLHKTTGGSDFGVCMTFQYVETPGSSQVLFATNTTAVGVGFRIITSADTLYVQQRGGTTATLNTGVSLSAGDNLVCVSHSHSGNTTKHAVNTTSFTEVPHTFGTTTTDASALTTIAAAGNDAGNMTNGTRIYATSIYDAYLTDANLAAIAGEYETRHSPRDYTP